jgi:tRNA-binding EMAP/Myf-like protein
MNISTRWLREWVSPDVSDIELSEKLTMAGLEVDQIAPVAPPFDGLVVGHVVSCGKHPNADKLSLCEVDVGADENLQIICGAPNVRKDLKVAVATVGSVLPSKLKIKRAKLRGVESNGMLCSESEMGMSDSHDGIIELDSESQIGEMFDQFSILMIKSSSLILPQTVVTVSAFLVLLERFALTMIFQCHPLTIKRLKKEIYHSPRQSATRKSAQGI